MKKICYLLSLLFALPVFAGKPQQLNSPDQVPDGLAKSDWQSIHAAHEGWKHQFQAVEGGWQAVNSGQQWTTRFDGRGFVTKPKDADWTWGLAFQSYGFGDRQVHIDSTPEVRAEGQRLTYRWSDLVEEWFVNDSRGLEHGFTIAERPEGKRENEELGFTIATLGPLKPKLAADGQTVYFRDAGGAPILNYSGLKVWDADGVVLPSRFQVKGSEICLLVEESTARYPLTIDPIAQQAYLKQGKNDGVTADDYFGYSVAVSGDTVVVGAYQEDSSTTGVNTTANESASNAGAAYVFVRTSGAWSQQAYLKASNTGTNDNFGRSVAVSGNTVVIGAFSEDGSNLGVNTTPNDGAINAGAAYVFVRVGTTWTQQAFLKASNTNAFDSFGYSVAVSGDTVVVGANEEDSDATGVGNSVSGSGAAYVFVRTSGVWTQQALLKASNTGANDKFGDSVAVYVDTIVVGAINEDSDATGVGNSVTESGAAYVFVRTSGAWTQQAFLKASNTGANDKFGDSVAVFGNTVVVGATSEDSGTNGVNSTPDESEPSAGAAYVFVRSSGAWTQQAYLKASNSETFANFGISVAVSGNTVVVGAYGEATNVGAAYVFVWSGTAWSQQAYLKASNAWGGDFFGQSVDVSGETVVVGAYGEDSSTMGVNSTPNEDASNAGAAYVYVRSGVSWSEQVYLKSEKIAEETLYDNFGRSVSISGDTVVVGAEGEDSSTIGVNSTPDESGSDSGAAYVFVRDGKIWSQQAYLKASNTGIDDNFGWSVAVSGNTIVVGAWEEDSGTKGVNTTPNESAAGSGAAYVFVRSGSTWSQQAYLKASNVGASNTGAGDNFGYSVAASGDTVVVGAWQEGSSTTRVNNIPNEDAPQSGAAYVFVRNNGVWIEQAYLKSSNTRALIHEKFDLFGSSVAVSDDTLVIGAPNEDFDGPTINDPSGAVYVFVRSGSTWTTQAYFNAGNTNSGAQFGHSVAVDGNTMVIGAPFESSDTVGVNSTPNDDATKSGAAYVYVRSGTAWSQEAYLKASNTGANDHFGQSVAVSGDTVVVGAYFEASSTMGVNSIPDDDAEAAGAAYVYVRRNGTMWEQQAYLKAFNTSAYNIFGSSVAISGETVVVGSTYEDSTSMGVNSTPNNSGLFASGSGAAYIFTCLGPGPTAHELFDDYVSAAGLSGNDALPAAIPFNDGVPNLLKYAFNMNAAGPDVRTLVPTTGTAGRPVASYVPNGNLPVFRFEFIRRKLCGLYYTPLESSTLTLGSWQPATGTTTVTSINPEWERVVIEQALTPSPAPMMFYRVEVELE